MGSGPDLLSVSPNGKYLYVSLDGAYSVQRMTLPALGTDIEIPLGSDYFGNSVFALDMQAAPNADATVAVVPRGVRSEPYGGRWRGDLRRRCGASECPLRKCGLGVLFE